MFDRMLRCALFTEDAFEEVEIPIPHQASPATTVIMLGEAFAYYRVNLATQIHNYGDVLWPRFLMGGIFTRGDYAPAQRVRNVLKRQMAETLTKADVLVTPTPFRPAGKYAEFGPLTGIDQHGFTGPLTRPACRLCLYRAASTRSGCP